MAGMKSFTFEVKGQKGAMPQIGLGTAGLEGEVCVQAVEDAISLGYRLIDTALLYGNQVEVGQGLQNSLNSNPEIKREDIWITSKVAFFPPESPDVWMFNANNIKGNEKESINLSLEQLKLDYVDLMLIHNPIAGRDEYRAACIPHFFEFFKLRNPKLAVKPDVLPDGEKLRGIVSRSRREAASLSNNPKAAYEIRKKSWKALEKAREEGKCRYIGVSNYSAELLLEMKEYATVMPAVNELEFHPRFASPKLLKVSKELGVVLTAYGSCHSVMIENNPQIDAIAKQLGKTPTQVVLKWTLQKGVAVIPRSQNKAHMLENLVLDFHLDRTDMETLSTLNEDYPYYWDPRPSTEAVLHSSDLESESSTKTKKEKPKSYVHLPISAAAVLLCFLYMLRK